MKDFVKVKHKRGVFYTDFKTAFYSEFKEEFIIQNIKRYEVICENNN